MPSQTVIRLIPQKSTKPQTFNMFDLKGLVDSKLIIGEQWGQDYLVIYDLDEAEVMFDLMNDVG